MRVGLPVTHGNAPGRKVKNSVGAPRGSLGSGHPVRAAVPGELRRTVDPLSFLRLAHQIILSSTACLAGLVVLCSALYVILSRKYDGATLKWAFTAVVAIISFLIGLLVGLPS